MIKIEILLNLIILDRSRTEQKIYYTQNDIKKCIKNFKRKKSTIIKLSLNKEYIKE